MMLKYSLNGKSKIWHGVELYQIEALIDIPEHGVKKGDEGGWIENEKNLSHEGNCWLNINSVVMEDASVEGNVYVKDSSLYQNCSVKGDSHLDNSDLRLRVCLDGGKIKDTFIEGDTVIQKGVSISNSKMSNVTFSSANITVEDCHLIFEDELIIDVLTGEELLMRNVKLIQHGNQPSLISRGGEIKEVFSNPLTQLIIFEKVEMEYVHISGTLVVLENEHNKMKIEIVGNGKLNAVKIEHAKLTLKETILIGEIKISGNLILTDSRISDFAQVINSKETVFRLIKSSLSGVSTMKCISKTISMKENVHLVDDMICTV